MSGGREDGLPDAASLAQLEEGGLGLRFSLVSGAAAQSAPVPVGATRVPAFAVRYGGAVHGWINRCPHRGTELDWAPGEFFDDERRHLVCATHGALFEPDTGLCVAGPCRGQRLLPVVLVPPIV